MACTNINNAKLLMFGGRREFTARRAELKKGRKALFQHPVKEGRMTNQQRQQRLERLIDFARQEEDRAVRRMTEARTRLEEQQQRLQLLENYQREYAARLSFNPGGSAGVFALQNYRAFMARIDEAVRQQRQVVERLAREHVQLAQAWNEQRTRTRGLQKVEEKLAANIAQGLARRDQRIQDEFALRLKPQATSSN